MKGYLITKPQDANSDLTATKHSLYRLSKSLWIKEAFKNYLADFQLRGYPLGEISSDLDCSSLCDIEKSSFKCFEIGPKIILPTKDNKKKNLLGHLPDLE